MADYFMRQMEGIADVLSVTIFGKKGSSEEEKTYEMVVSTGAQTLMLDLRLMLLAGKVNEAENRLFDAIKAGLELEYFDAAMQFYEWLDRMDPAELAACGFGVEEIEEGRLAVAALYGR